MSWSGYVDYLVGSGVVPKAAIFGALDGAIWAKSADLDVSIVYQRRRAARGIQRGGRRL
jgi:hypothetical protein